MNATPRRPRSTDESVPQNPQTSPNLGPFPSSGMDGFIWQQINDLNRATGEIKSTQTHILEKLDAIDVANKEKLRSIEGDLSDVKKTFHAAKWVGYFVGGVVSLAFAFVVFLAKEAWDLAKPSLVQKISAPVAGDQKSPSSPK